MLRLTGIIHLKGNQIPTLVSIVEASGPIRYPDFNILMTACIAPKAGVREGLKRADPAVRIRDYQRALSFWLGLKSDRIRGVVFAENSGYPLDEIQESIRPHLRLDREIEFLSFDFPPTPPGLNYGFSEFELIAESIRRSQLLTKARYFVKATGRYEFPDINRLLRLLPSDFHVAVDSKGLLPCGIRSMPIASVALAVFDRQFFENELSTLRLTMIPAPPWNRKQYIEHVLFDALYPRRSDRRIILRWPCNCEPIGIGANGDDYNSLRKRIQHAVRSIARKVAPNFWV